MPLIKLDIKPGIYRDGTKYSAEGLWYDCNKVRFRKGQPEKIGGWSKYSSVNFIGAGRKIHDWATIDGSLYVGVGSTYKLYIQEGASFNDVTPLRATATLGSNPFTTVNATGLVTVAHTAHGATRGSYVTFSGTTGPFGGVPAADFNQEHRVVSVPDANSYTIVVDTVATSGTSGGGSSVVAAYQANIGLDTFVTGSGWGSGSWGSGGWGGGTSTNADNQLRLWTMDNYGDDLLACPRQGGVFYWDQTNGISTRAIKIEDVVRRTVTLGANPITTTNTSATFTVTDLQGHGAGVGDLVTLAGAATTNGIPDTEINAEHAIVATPTDTTFTVTVSTTATSTGSGGGSSVTASYKGGTYYSPSKGLQVMTSDVARHAIVLGSTDINSASLDPLLVRWSDAENAADWNPRATNAAGGQRLSAGSKIVGGLRTRQEILIWTDVNLVSMRYVGQPFVFSFNEIAANVSMVSPNAAASAKNSVYFMDRGTFYEYSGSVKKIFCPIRDYIFSDINLDQASKVVAGTNVDFSEIVWLYQSTSSATGEIDKYVIYNYEDGAWVYGTLNRAYWSEASTKTYPLASEQNVSKITADNISTTNTSGSITVAETAHGLSVGDVVILSNMTALGGIAEELFNQDHDVATVPDADSYTVTVPDLATSTASGSSAVTVTVRKPSYLQSHENGHDADGSAMTAYIESASMDIEDGDRFWFIDRLIPDIEFRDSASGSDTVTISLRGKDYPGDTDSELSSSAITPTTKDDDIRVRAREVALKAQSTGSGYGWRLGHQRISARKSGRR